MKTIVLNIFGSIQLLNIPVFIYIYYQFSPVLTSIFVSFIEYELYSFVSMYLLSTGFLLTIIFMGASISFAFFFLNYNKFVLFFALGSGIEITLKFFLYFLSLDHILGIFPLELLIVPIIFLVMLISIFFFKVVPNYKETARVKTQILNLSTDHPDIKVVDISKRCSVDKSTVIKIVKKMIRNNEIYADYFKHSRKFAFNNLANTEKIDELLNLYNEWEREKIGNKSS